MAGNAVRISAQLIDANGNFTSTAGTVVTWSSLGGGTFSSVTSATDSSGVAGVEHDKVIAQAVHFDKSRHGAGYKG